MKMCHDNKFKVTDLPSTLPNLSRMLLCKKAHFNHAMFITDELTPASGGERGWRASYQTQKSQPAHIHRLWNPVTWKWNMSGTEAKTLFPGFGKLGSECVWCNPSLSSQISPPLSFSPSRSFLWVRGGRGRGEKVHHEHTHTHTHQANPLRGGKSHFAAPSMEHTWASLAATATLQYWDHNSFLDASLGTSWARRRVRKQQVKPHLYFTQSWACGCCFFFFNKWFYFFIFICF